MIIPTLQKRVLIILPMKSRNSAGYTVTKTVTVTVKNDHVAEQMVKQSVRSISADYLNTLDMNSKWKKQTVLYQKLTGTLTSPIVEERWGADIIRH